MVDVEPLPEEVVDVDVEDGGGVKLETLLLGAGFITGAGAGAGAGVGAGVGAVVATG